MTSKIYEQNYIAFYILTYLNELYFSDMHRSNGLKPINPVLCKCKQLIKKINLEEPK